MDDYPSYPSVTLEQAQRVVALMGWEGDFEVLMRRGTVKAQWDGSRFVPVRESYIWAVLDFIFGTLEGFEFLNGARMPTAPLEALPAEVRSFYLSATADESAG